MWTLQYSALMRIAFVTGRHTFDVVALHQMLRQLDGIDAYVQHMEDFADDRGGDRPSYDAVVFYHMLVQTPQDGDPWPLGRVRKAIEAIPSTKQGVVILHHGLVAWPEWPVWSNLVGIPEKGRNIVGFSDMAIHVEKPDHPIARGLTDWVMYDEFYHVAEPAAHCDVFLTTNTPGSMRSLAWTHTVGQARIACMQNGHGPQAWNHPSFRQLLTQAIRWSAGQA